MFELHLEAEARLHAAVPALRAARGLVRVDARRVEAVAAEVVRRGQELPRVVRGHQPERRVGAAVQQVLIVDREDLPVPRGAQLRAHFHRVAAAV